MNPERIIPSLIAKSISAQGEIANAFCAFDLRFKDDYPANKENIASAARALGDNSGKLYSAHLHNIQLSKPEERVVDDLISTIKLLSKSFPGMRVVTAHCGNGGGNYLLRNLKLADQALAKECTEVRLAVENLTNVGSNLFSTGDLRGLAAETRKMSNVGICIDTSHVPPIARVPGARQDIAAEYTRSVEELFSLAKPRLYLVHFSDFVEEEKRRDHLIPGSGMLDWRAILGALDDASYEGKCVLELTREHNNLIGFEKAIRYLSKISR